MSYQFFHIESYAREAGKGKAGGHTSKSILAEAKREIDSCPHVISPHAPTVLFGNLDEVEGEARKWAESSVDAIGRKLRKDGHCLLGGVFSAPDEMTASDWSNYRDEAVEWLRERYGDRLRCVIEHKDEDKRHCHFYALPRPSERFENLHPGKAAALAAKSEGKKKGEQNRAYCEAMREFQTDFWTVSRNYGLARIGPKKRRLTRAAWKAEQVQARAVQDAQAEALRVLAEAETTTRAAVAKEAKAVEQTKLWNKATAECKRERADLQIESARIRESKRIISSIGGKFGAFFGGAKNAYKRSAEKIRKLLENRSLQKQLYDEKEKTKMLEKNQRDKSVEEAKLRARLQASEKSKLEAENRAVAAESDANEFKERAKLALVKYISTSGKIKEIELKSKIRQR